ncbi:MAG TPA: rhomboid family intramembrane serine protease [Steroidobacteraceae bacterium]
MAVVPLSDASRPLARFPLVTILIVTANIVCFVLELAGGGTSITGWSVIPAQIAGGHRLVTLITATYMHGSWIHIIGNMLFLWAFGPTLEDAMGRGAYFLFYSLGGVVGMLCQVAVSTQSTLPCLGASGAIAAVMGAFLVTYPRDRIKSLLIIGWFVRTTFIPAAVLIGVWFAIQLLSAGAMVSQEQGGVAYAAHIGGVIFGVVLGRLFEGPRRLFE